MHTLATVTFINLLNARASDTQAAQIYVANSEKAEHVS